MKIVAYETARVTSLFPFEEVLPLGGLNDREVVEAIKDRYAFAKVPELASEEASTKGYKFELGRFQFDSKPFRISDFAIFRDGIVINAATTDGAESFLDDVVEFMQNEFSFREFITRPRRFFLSQIVVEFEHPPEKLMQSIKELASIISAPIREIYQIDVNMRFSRLDFDFDKTSMPTPMATAIQRFIIERRIGVSFDYERYFTSAPVRTSSHVGILEALERLVTP